ncbi:unnamed protein product [Durusdinium trenchii]|uniref:Uncharacterized protein n=1 Tax=Durusdinium trenchii TaxID=1381693 RepID=A0ABP0QHM2_9DINO
MATSSGVTLPMTLEALMGYDEPGNEAQFCAVLGLPLKRTHRGRPPSGCRRRAFICRWMLLEDKVFICPQDNRERKVERKRLQQRAEV